MDLCLSSRVPPSGRREQAEEGRGAGLRLVLLTYGCHWNPFPVLPGHLQPNNGFLFWFMVFWPVPQASGTQVEPKAWWASTEIGLISLLTYPVVTPPPPGVPREQGPWSQRRPSSNPHPTSYCRSPLGGTLPSQWPCLRSWDGDALAGLTCRVQGPPEQGLQEQNSHHGCEKQSCSKPLSLCFAALGERVLLERRAPYSL